MENLRCNNIQRIFYKTPSFRVAFRFALSYDSANIRFLVVNYLNDSQYINLDVRTEKNEEYEYLTKSGERLELSSIQFHYLGCGRILKLYIMSPFQIK